MKTKPSNVLRLVIWLALLMMSWQTAVAHGGGALQIANAPVADYQISVWTNPPTARAGQTIHVTVGVAFAGTGEPMLDANVQITVLAANGQLATSAAATTEQSVNRLFYEADLGGLPAGDYEMVVEVSGPAGRGPVSLPLSVTPASFLPWILAALGVVALVSFVLSWRKRGKVGVPVRKTAVPRAHSLD